MPCLSFQNLSAPQLVLMPAPATISVLPPELLLRIFSGLHYRDLVSARRTCSSWREVSEDDLLWRGLVTRHLGPGSWLHDDTIPSRVEMALAVLLGMLTSSRYVLGILGHSKSILISAQCTPATSP